ncbi:NF-kappa-B essential modulator isoform X2 [Electrophorus electricus]|uniref:NF-kappa-B essential modulator n=1 Tax=Electrophorus electricus TaxID=8005 RepID=A0A4W4GL99_ELEEL|nr:NF-kappa-B essential modulator isoform X2 [Electrophorus electricus]
MVQPQPHGDSALQWEMTGEEAIGTSSQGSLVASSQASLRVPPELAGNEVVHRLLADNNQLREALKRSNDALKDRCEEMEGWQRRSREEREFLACKFREARALVERLAQENQSLLGKLKHSQTAAQIDGTAETGSQVQNQVGSNTEINGLTNSPEALDEPTGKGITERDTDTRAIPRSLPIEGSNEFLRLLKSHKDKLEEGMRDLRRRNNDLEREKTEIEKEREELRLRLSQLSQSAVIMEETVQKNAFTVPIERYKELQEKLNILQQNSIQRDRNEALLKQKEKDYVQLTKDIEALRAQVTSLVGELHERQTCLNKCEEEKNCLEEKLCSKTEDLQILEREMEQQKKQHCVTVDKFLLQTQNLEAALKNERLVIVEEKRKLAQLQHAYTCLFQDYDNKLKNEQANSRGGETETLINRLDEAEKALALKQAHIDKLKEEVEQQRALQETIQVLTAQAEIYKLDFQAEREAREKLHQKKEDLQEKLSQALAEINLLKQEKMQQRHTDNYRGVVLPAPAPFQGPVISQPNRLLPEVQPDYRCPKCQYQAPDMDTLQIHVMDCIQ